jgi:hypothetical protein
MAVITGDHVGLFGLGLSVWEVGQVAHSNASKAPGLKGVPDSLLSSLAYPLPSDFSPPRKTKHYYYYY